MVKLLTPESYNYFTRIWLFTFIRAVYFDVIHPPTAKKMDLTHIDPEAKVYITYQVFDIQKRTSNSPSQITQNCSIIE